MARGGKRAVAQVDRDQLADDELEALDEQEETDSEPEGEPAISPSGPTDYSKMTKEEILEALARRRQELNQVAVAAKAAGIKVDKPKGTKKTDESQLEWLADRLGYQIGMRTWSQGRIDQLAKRIEPVIVALDEAFGVERRQEFLEALGGGYLKAKIGTGFESELFPDKASAEAAKSGDAIDEVLDRVRGEGLTFLFPQD